MKDPNETRTTKDPHETSENIRDQKPEIGYESLRVPITEEAPCPRVPVEKVPPSLKTNGNQQVELDPK